MGFPTKNDHFGVEIGGTTILGNPHILTKQCLVNLMLPWLTEVMRKATTVKGLVQLRRRRFRLKMLGKKGGGLEAQTIHVWDIYPDLVLFDFYDKCR